MTKQETINDTLWRACDTFRGVINSDQYKDYILVMLFIKYLSDVYKEHVEEYREKYNGDEVRIQRALARERFILDEHSTFDYLYSKRSDSSIGQIINTALERIEESNKGKLRGVFRNIDFNNESVFGKTKERNSMLKNLIEDFNSPDLDLRPSKVGNQDIIGNAYEYLIAKFASDAGRKGGEFFTPPEVSEMLARLIKPKENDRIYDPTCGSGSLLIKSANQVPNRKVQVYGQERNGSTYSLCRMNMFLHNIDDAKIEWGDTISNPLHLENNRLMKFQVVVANPPFSLDKWAKGFDSGSASEETTVDGKKKDTFKFEKGMDSYRRFEWGVPPSSKGDYAFVLHMINSMAEDGRMAVVLPHGVLFREASEGIIRKHIIESNFLDAIIGLPENLFFGAAIPAIILVFRKNRARDNLLFIDASNEYDKDKNQNRLKVDSIEKIVKTYEDYTAIPKYSYVASIKEIRKNNYNLNIPRYINTFQDEELADIDTIKNNISKIKNEIHEVEQQVLKLLDDLDI